MERILEEDKTLKNEEDTSTATGEAEEENETESEEDTSTNDSETTEDKTEEVEEEESVEALKARLEKAEKDRDNYKQGMLSAKGKKRVDEGLTKETKTDVSEEAVIKVLSKREEQKALQNTIISTHPDYIPELVDDNQYQEIIGYLPRNVDKTSYDSIVRGLKLATEMWKKDKGIQDKQPKKDTGLQTTKSTTSTGTTKPVVKSGRKILKQSGGIDTWYN